ncbi:hypothetical protein SPBRAN_1966 [uncultured Candidatus Thioglobus sp.]|nr:hypothetical protein SPBRAN_1966 [uncultured Candidatus Thioglobus sp.]
MKGGILMIIPIYAKVSNYYSAFYLILSAFYRVDRKNPIYTKFLV